MILHERAQRQLKFAKCERGKEKLTESKTKVRRIQIGQRGIDRERGHQKERLRRNEAVSLRRGGTRLRAELLLTNLFIVESHSVEDLTNVISTLVTIGETTIRSAVFCCRNDEN